MSPSMWCATCDKIVADTPACSCGADIYPVTHPLDMVELLITAQALHGLVTVPPGFESTRWDIDALQDDIDARDELMTMLTTMGSSLH
jgi:hypothetical protein